MSPERENKIIAYMKKLRHEMSFTPYEFEREIKEIDELLRDETPVIKLVPTDLKEREPKINELL